MVSNPPILKPPGILRVNDVFRLQTQVVRWIKKDVGGQQDSKDRISRWRFKSLQRNTIEQPLYIIYVYIYLWKTKGCSFEEIPHNDPQKVAKLRLDRNSEFPSMGTERVPFFFCKFYMQSTEKNCKYKLMQLNNVQATVY